MDCWLHIGTDKTGTTSIQRFLRSNREMLKAQGYYFPLSLGRGKQVALSLYTKKASRLTDKDPVWRHSRFKDSSTFHAVVERRLAREMARVDAPSVVMSAEGLHRRSPAAILRLKALLEPWFSKIYVVIYLRSQDSYALSQYQQNIRGGKTLSLEEHLLGTLRENDHDYHAKIQRWADIFGREAVRPRVFERSRFVDGSLICDFLATIGIEDRAWVVEEAPKNESMDAESVALLSEYNAKLFAGLPHKQQDELRRRLVKLLVARASGVKLALPQDWRDRIIERWHPTNAKVARDWFGRADGRLFDAL
jgi:hypothetical protein